MGVVYPATTSLATVCVMRWLELRPRPDVFVLVRAFLLIGHIDVARIRGVDGDLIAALLTVVGYSINDSVSSSSTVCEENLRILEPVRSLTIRCSKP